MVACTHVQMWIRHSLGGRGLLSAEDKVVSECVALYHYLKDHSGALNLMKKVVALSFQMMQLLFPKLSKDILMWHMLKAGETSHYMVNICVIYMITIVPGS